MLSYYHKMPMKTTYRHNRLYYDWNHENVNKNTNNYLKEIFYWQQQINTKNSTSEYGSFRLLSKK